MIFIIVVGILDVDLFVVHEIVTFIIAEASVVATIATTFLLHSLVFRSTILEPHFYLDKRVGETKGHFY